MMYPRSTDRACEPLDLVAHPSTALDRAFHAELFAQSRRDDLRGSGLDTEQVEGMAHFQEHSFEEMLHTHQGAVEDLTWVLDQRKVARLVLHHGPNYARIMWIVVAEAERRAGIGRQIVGWIQQRYDVLRAHVTRENSAALGLCSEADFTLIDDTANSLILQWVGKSSQGPA